MPAAAPTVAKRGTPATAAFDQGYRSLIVLGNNTAINFFEKDVQPPGFDGGEPIETTTFFNTLYETAAPRVLVKNTPVEITAAYHSSVHDQIVAQLNVNQSITVYFPDGSYWCFWGWLQKFQPDGIQRGKQPEAKITLIVSNTDTAGLESPSIYSAGSGTGTGV